jgi:ABC-type uncharacterized transport system YnjBCD permease subunit
MTEIIQQLGALFALSPSLSIILLFAFAGFIVWLLRDVIKDVFRNAAKKWFKLSDEDEIATAVQKAVEERPLYDMASDKLTPSMESRVLTHLRKAHAGE